MAVVVPEGLSVMGGYSFSGGGKEEGPVSHFGSTKGEVNNKHVDIHVHVHVITFNLEEGIPYITCTCICTRTKLI